MGFGVNGYGVVDIRPRGSPGTISATRSDTGVEGTSRVNGEEWGEVPDTGGPDVSHHGVHRPRPVRSDRWWDKDLDIESGPETKL